MVINLSGFKRLQHSLSTDLQCNILGKRRRFKLNISILRTVDIQSCAFTCYAIYPFTPIITFWDINRKIKEYQFFERMVYERY